MSRSSLIPQRLNLLLLHLLIMLCIAPGILSLPTKHIYPEADLERRQQNNIEPSPGGKIYTIAVGRAAHAFKPNSVTAQIGDVIKFEFYPTNHSVVRASFDSPCVPREMMDPKQTGFFSGFFPLDSVPDNVPSWSWKVDTNDPVFFYCSGEDSCIHWGMVGVINPSKEQTLSEFTENAKKADYQLSPGEPFPDESVKKPSSSNSKPKSKDTLSTGVIVGISLAAVAIVVVFGVIFYFLGKWRISNKKDCASPNQSQALLYTHPGAHEGIEVMSTQPGVQRVAASYYDYPRGDARIGSYYDPPNSLHVSSIYMSPGPRYSQGQGVLPSQKGTVELGTQAFSPVELAEALSPRR